ncbi:uncharacterized protein TM35_000301340 [Trypanosoma theileri]|uniref:Transmembrane protein n=1 Tax=Trypanosoma theileri TaxID=67003 RepID=A0A1X0NN12_9TRYP|nr:uncharacterized protein TM35_000301340 [Trypanosoma theileri]ORC86094.1 hypothetical protein TM35_000301340 [Trypanosoma theileri]
MRYRQRNVQESEKTKIKKLFNSNDALSTHEQEEVLKYLANSLHSSVMCVRVLAVLQLLLGILYVCLLAAGYPLVYAVFDEALTQPFTTTTSTSSFKLLTKEGAVAITLAAFFLFSGGLGVLRACRRTLCLDVEALLQGSIVTTSTSSSSSSSLHMKHNKKNDRVWEWWVVGDTPRRQYTLAFLSLWPCVYWLYVMHAYHRHLAQKEGVMFSLTDNWMEFVLVLWQPFMHIIIGRMLSSTITGREDLIRLAKMKYQYDKL